MIFKRKSSASSSTVVDREWNLWSKSFCAMPCSCWETATSRVLSSQLPNRIAVHLSLNKTIWKEQMLNLLSDGLSEKFSPGFRPPPGTNTPLLVNCAPTYINDNRKSPLTDCATGRDSKLIVRLFRSLLFINWRLTRLVANIQMTIWYRKVTRNPVIKSKNSATNGWTTNFSFSKWMFHLQPGDVFNCSRSANMDCSSKNKINPSYRTCTEWPPRRIRHLDFEFRLHYSPWQSPLHLSPVQRMSASISVVAGSSFWMSVAEHWISSIPKRFWSTAPMQIKLLCLNVTFSCPFWMSSAVINAR